METKPNTFCVQMAWTLDEAEELKKFALILTTNAYACILDWNFDKILILLRGLILDQSNNRFDMTTRSELQSIWKKAKNYLLQSLLICFYQRRLISI